jgi:hypothetical protein
MHSFYARNAINIWIVRMFIIVRLWAGRRGFGSLHG